VQPISRGGAPSPAIATAVGVASRFRPHDAAEGAGAPVRIRPGRPEASVLFTRMASRDPLAQMPPLGTHAVDEEALALVAAWIGELPAEAAVVSTPDRRNAHRR
jgi:mono/diheme cytochrome c family protein